MPRSRHPLPVDALCARLTCARQARKIRLCDLAKRIGVDRRVLWNWETGRHLPILPLLRAWVEALGFELDISKREPLRRVA